MSWSRPELRNCARYLASSSTSLTYPLTSSSRLRLSVAHAYNISVTQLRRAINGKGSLLISAGTRF